MRRGIILNNLKQSVQFMKGVGPKRLKYLEQLNIYNIEDLLYSFPREYEDRRNIKKIIDMKDHEKTTVIATVFEKVQEKSLGKGRKLFKLPVKDDTGIAYAVFYNSSFIKKIFKKGDIICLHGKINKSFGEIQILHPNYELVENNQLDRVNGILPIYGLVNGLSQGDMRNLHKQVLMFYKDQVEEFLPDDTIQRNRLCDIQYALSNIHFPQTVKSLKVAKYRLIFEELLILQLGLWLIKNRSNRNAEGISFDKTASVMKLIESLPFQLTNAQIRAWKEIEADMESSVNMNRLVQGDVGSGKTIIALLALYKTVLNGYQGVLMAPTEILAEQHLHSAKELLEPFGIKIELLSGSISKKKRTEILNGLKNQDIDIIIGTHALIQEKVTFHNVGLVITDEQHRFGVRQRGMLSNKGINPDVLVMTATPIPRTLALILYGDVDISIIDELPPGRKKIKTYCVNEKKRKEAYVFVRKQIEEGRQAYIVAPLVEESENIDAKSAQDIYNEFKEGLFKHYKIGLLHGKMKAFEKESIMRQFKSGEIQLLVSTTVIEVGVNVPNASTMVIENSERFGLAQLHQLRGRVGRGDYQSYCILMNDRTSSLSQERMKIMEQTDNGFIIAEKDLELRGPGEFFGTKQHGLPELKIANLFKHMKILRQVQKEAKLLIDEDKILSSEKNKLLKNKIMDVFQNNLEELCL
ncbi:ATP-dependent DNA helicase RecG [Clostridiaceae bacterium 35-E11]